MKKIVILLLISFAGFSQVQNKKLTEELEDLAKSSSFPGFAVAIVNQDGIQYQNAFGWADIENKKPFTTTSVMNIASISKTFIAVSLMKAIDLGYFDLETNINDILPFKVTNPNSPSDIRIKHLVTHTSGILDNEKTYGTSFLVNEYSDTNSPLYKTFVNKATIPNRTDVELSVFLKNYFEKGGLRYHKSNFSKEKAGVEYNYSNIASALAAYLIEIKSYTPFDVFCDTYVLKPLALQGTAWKMNANLFSNHVKIYNQQKEFYPLYSEITYPDGCMKTSTQDLATYLHEMIKGYKGKSSLLSQNSFKLMFDKQFSENQLPRNNDKKEPNGGVFWRYRNNGNIGHAGGDLGVTTFMYFNPETGIGKIFIANQELDSPFQAELNKELVAQFVKIWKTLEKYEQ